MPTQLPLATTGLLPMEQPQTGLLGTNFMDPRTQMALSVAASLLESGGPSLTPTSLGQSLGRATRAGLDSYEQGRQQAVQTALLKRQMLRQDKQDARQDADFAREEQLREMFPSAFNEDGTVNPAAISDIARVAPGVATQLAGMLPATSREPKYQVIDATLPDGRKIQGRINVNAENPEATFQPIGSPETAPIPAEAAAKKAAIDQGVALIPEIKRKLFATDQQGNVIFNDQGVPDLRESTVIDTPFISTNQAKRELTPVILSAVEAILRAESGAAVPPDEVRRAAERYMPSPIDSDEAAWRKIQLLEDRLKRSQEAVEVGRPGSRTTGPQSGGGWSIEAVG